ncbi:TatD family hydrolase [Patescibacteria group bacterium]
MYIDTHCHLTFPKFSHDINMVIGNAKKANVKKIICPGVDMLSSQQSIQLANKHKHTIYSSIGLHPYEAQKNRSAYELEQYISDTVVAIGECGLDYHLYKGEKAESKKTNQKRLFQEHIEIADKYKRPAIIHCRDAFDDLFQILDSINTISGVIHCFSGGLQDIRDAQKRGLYVGIDGNITYSKQLQHIVSHIPLSMLLIETDSPYLTPIPHRGERNEPKYLPYIAKNIAKLHRTTPEHIAQITSKNAIQLFSLP